MQQGASSPVCCLLPMGSPGSWGQGGEAVLTFARSQPTVRFSEDTLLLPPGEDGEREEGALPGRQRLTRKDTPHYKKQFKVSKLPQPEAVVALLQGVQPDGEGPAGLGSWHNGPHTPWAPRTEEEGAEEDAEEAVAAEEEEEEEAVALVPSVKVGLAPFTPDPAATSAMVSLLVAKWPGLCWRQSQQALWQLWLSGGTLFKDCEATTTSGQGPEAPSCAREPPSSCPGCSAFPAHLGLGFPLPFL